MADSKVGAPDSVMVPRMRVSDIEDRIVGEVLAIQPRGFCIGMERESFWVSYDIVFRIDGQTVLLLCTREGIDKYRLADLSPS